MPNNISITSTIAASGGNGWVNHPAHAATNTTGSMYTTNGSNSTFTTGNLVVGAGGGYVFTNTYQTSSIVQLNNSAGEVVRLNNDCTVTWANGIDVDEAAEAFSKSMTVGAELSVGITNKVKREMRDTVFEEIISIAKQKGSLSADDLTYFWEAAKIMDKLKGAKE